MLRWHNHLPFREWWSNACYWYYQKTVYICYIDFQSLIKQSRTSFWKHKHSNANPFNHTSSRSFRATDIPHRKNADEFIESKPITRTLPALSNRRELWRCLTSSWISFYPPPALLSPHIVPRNLTRHRLHFAVAPFNI